MVAIKEIAQITKTSSTSVRLVLSNKRTRISQKTRERILNIAKELDYQPDALVHALQSKATYAIAVMAPVLSVSFYQRSLSGSIQWCPRRGFNR